MFSGWPEDLDLLRHAGVRGSRGHPEQGARHLRRLLVPRGPHVRAPHRHTALHRHRPHEDLQHHPQGDRRHRLPPQHHAQGQGAHQETLQVSF
jgi:hypothetical protein